MGRKNGKKGGKGKKNGGQKNQNKWQNGGAVKGVAQGAAGVTNKAFGKSGDAVKGNHNTWFNANHPHHLALPRAVGNYTVCRLTARMSTSSDAILFAPWFNEASSSHELLPFCALQHPGFGGPMSNTNNTTTVDFPSMRTLGNSRIVPSAFSIQLMNPNALQTTSGNVYVGRMQTKPKFSSVTKTWSEYFNDLTSYNAPRICPAAKLSMRGITVNAVPYNMNEAANFQDIGDEAAGNFTWDGSGGFDPEPYMFAPIFVSNPTNLSMEILVTVEFRTRFDPENPAQASHSYHPPTSEGLWARAMRALNQQGHGVMDIVESVASTGLQLAGNRAMSALMAM